MEFLTIVLVGSLVGVATGLLPGLHVNTLAAIAFAWLPAAGPDGAVFLLAVGMVHTIVNILPTTYLGAPDEDDVLAILPAHRLLLAGRGAEAVAVSVGASLAGVLLACLGAWALRHAWTNHAWMARIEAWTPIILIGATALMWLQESRRGLVAVFASVLVTGLAAGLGLWAAQVPIAPLVQVPPSALLPLLGGLFGAAGLTVAWQRPPPVPWQPDARHATRRMAPVIGGSSIAALTAFMPGLTASVATAMVPGIRGRPLHAVAAMSAINTAHATMAILFWAASGRIRTGLADALNVWAPVIWVGHSLPTGLRALVIALLVASVAGAAGTIALDHVIRRHVDRLPARALAMAGLLFLTALVIVLSGWAGFVVYALGIAIGRMPIRFGIRRVHLVGALIVPAIIWHWT